jgi:ketosteroid isomerase-like protein
MSEENVEIVRRMFELFKRGDVEGVAEFMSDDVLCITSPTQPDAQVFRGRAEFVAYGRSWLEVFDEYEVDTTEFLDRGDHVVVVGHVRARGRSSGAVIEDDDAWLYRLSNGQVVEYRECGTKAQALEAAGLAE